MTFPTAVAWAMLRLPIASIERTLARLGTKSIVTAEGVAGSESVAVSPVSASSRSSSGRAMARDVEARLHARTELDEPYAEAVPPRVG